MKLEPLGQGPLVPEPHPDITEYICLYLTVYQILPNITGIVPSDGLTSELIRLRDLKRRLEDSITALQWDDLRDDN